MVQAIIFDINGVLFLPKSNKEKHLLNSFKEACKHLSDFGIDGYAVFDELFPIYQKNSCGEISREETALRMSKVLDITLEKVGEYFCNVYAENTYRNDELYEYILKIKEQANIKIALLSTQIHFSKESLVPKEFYDNFDVFEISCDSNTKKPDSKAFENTVSKLKIDKKNILFIDDQQKCVDAGNEYGIHSILFENNKKLFTDLCNLM